MKLPRSSILATSIVVTLAFGACMPARAIDADDWGYGFYSASHISDTLYHFDVTLHLRPLDWIASSGTIAPDDDVVVDSLRFTGIQWQPDGNNHLNNFADGTFEPLYLALEDGTPVPWPTDIEAWWVHGAGDSYGQISKDGYVGITVDDDGQVPGPPPYDIHAGSNKPEGGVLDGEGEYNIGIPLHSDKETLFRFHVNIFVPDGLGEQNAQFGWTGKKPQGDNPHPGVSYIQAQNSTVLTPELPAVGLMLPTLLGCAGFYWRRWRHRAP